MGSRRGHGEGAIYQRESDGKWVANLDLGWRNGKRQRKVIYGKTRREVAEKLKALQREQTAGQLVISERQTLGDYLDRWLETSVRPYQRPKTVASYEQVVNLYIKPHLGHQLLHKLEPEQLQKFFNRLLSSGGRNGKQLSPRTVQYVRAVLRRALNQALKWGYIGRNAAALTEAPKVRRFEPVILSPAQSQHFLNAAAGNRLEALYTVATALGLREGEVLGLRWCDISFEQHTLRVAQTVQRLKGGLSLEPPKTERSARLLPLPVFVERALTRHAESQALERAAAGDEWQDFDLVFPSIVGTPLDPRNLLRQFQALLARAGLPKMRFHDLRHSCATTLIAQGIHPRVVQEILGHSQISTTMNVYGHVLDATRRAAADAMDGLFLTGDAGELPRDEQPESER